MQCNDRANIEVVWMFYDEVVWMFYEVNKTLAIKGVKSMEFEVLYIFMLSLVCTRKSSKSLSSCLQIFEVDFRNGGKDVPTWMTCIAMDSCKWHIK